MRSHPKDRLTHYLLDRHPALAKFFSRVRYSVWILSPVLAFAIYPLFSAAMKSAANWATSQTDVLRSMTITSGPLGTFIGGPKVFNALTEDDSHTSELRTPGPSVEIELEPVMKITDTSSVNVMLFPGYLSITPIGSEKEIRRGPPSQATVRMEQRVNSRPYKVGLVAPKTVLEVFPDEPLVQSATAEEPFLEWNWSISPKKLGTHEVRITGLPLKASNGTGLTFTNAEELENEGKVTGPKMMSYLSGNGFRIDAAGTLVLGMVVLDENGFTSRQRWWFDFSKGAIDVIATGILCGLFTALGTHILQEHRNREEKRHAPEEHLIITP